MLRWLCLLSIIAGCASADAGAVVDDQDQTGRTHAYVDVNPDAPLPPLARTKLQAALAKIDGVAKRGKSPIRRALAAETLARIEAGDVLLGSIAGSRGIDRWHMCRDYELPSCKGAPPPDDDRTWRGDAAVSAKLEHELAGYQWGNRLYFTLTDATDTDELASTLVHETNHVLNRSECHYYTDIATHAVDADHAYVEEFRAFLAECYFTHDATATPETCAVPAAKSTDDYGFATLHKEEPQRIAVLVLGAEPDGPAPFGRLVPRSKDFPRSFPACR